MSAGEPVFVVFEGLDGSGKTTAAQRTADLIGATYMTTPSTTLRRRRDEIIASFQGSQEAAQLFYMATVFAASADVARCLASGQSVVLDRYFLSTQAYAAFRGTILSLDCLARDLLAPSLTVFLDAPLEVRRARVAHRGRATEADSETLSDDADAVLRKLHMARAELPAVGPFRCLDSALLRPDEIAMEVAATLHRSTYDPQ